MKYIFLLLFATNLHAANLDVAVTNLETGEVIQPSNGTVFYGASIVKIYVAAAFLEQGNLTRSEKRLVHDMITVSSNSAWRMVEKRVGKTKLKRFTKRRRYKNTLAYRVKGNRINCNDVMKFLHDTYWNNYTGSESLWETMSKVRTGFKRGRKYLPNDLIVREKTGTWKSYRHHILSFKKNGTQYGVCVLTQGKSNEWIAEKLKNIYKELK